LNCHNAPIQINPQEFSAALKILHNPQKQSPLLKEQLQLIKHRFHYIQTEPLKVLSQDRGFHKTLYLQEQKQLHCLLGEVRSLHESNPIGRANHEKGLYECLRNIVYDPELDYSKYELAKEIVSRRTVVCHIQIAAMNIISLMMIDKNLQSMDEMRKLFEELFTYFLFERLTSAACVNNRVTQALSLHFSYMPMVVSSILKTKLEFVKTDNIHHIENASFLNRLLTNFNIYFSQLEQYKQITNQHKIYDIITFYKDLHEVDNTNIDLADEVMTVILSNKQALITFFQEIFSAQNYITD
jgi:hypothetical protein